MKAAFLDTSFIVAIALGERGARRLRLMLDRFDALFAAELLRAEFLSVTRREGLSLEAAGRVLDGVSFVLPDRSIRPEIERVLAAGYLRGADLWHLACACYLAPRPAEVAFLSCDARQRKVARALGFSPP